MQNTVPQSKASDPCSQPVPKVLDVYSFVPSAIYRHKKAPPPPLSEDEILEWADAYFDRHGDWPLRTSGVIPEAPGETWGRVNGALINGLRGLLGDSSLSLLLWEQRGRRHPLYLPHFTVEEILQWADAFFERTGEWPGVDSGPIPESPGDTWQNVRGALTKGLRGLPGGTTLSRLLVEQRGARNHCHLPLLLEEEILQWADAHFARLGVWPDSTCDNVAIPEAPGETWGTVRGALANGTRGLSGRSSLALLLAQKRGVQNVYSLQMLSEDLILRWADAYHARHGDWPVSHNKIDPERNVIPESPADTWSGVNCALTHGLRGLPGGSSLACLLEEKRGKQHRLHLSLYTLELILQWADLHFERVGKWPVTLSGPIPESPGDTWAGVNAALDKGSRGLPGGSSLALLLEEQRGKRNHLKLAPLTEAKILRWADAFHKRTGVWPTLSAGPVRGCPDSTWATLNDALHRGSRGLRGDSSLALLLAEKRGALNAHTLPDFTEEQILAWADAHFARTGSWPTCNFRDPIPECPAENWRKVSNALRLGLRGMPPGGPSLAVFLAARRGKRHIFQTLRFTEAQILQWADAHFARDREWPTRRSGPVPEAPGETWSFVDVALTQGVRGLPGGSSLARLLAQERGKRNNAALPPLSEGQILAWADAHHAQTGHYPCLDCGLIPEAPGETWMTVQGALIKGTRGLAGGSSVALLMAEKRGERNLRSLPPLTEELILSWADAHYARTGEWPECRDHGHNPVVDAPSETWDALSGCLMKGSRGLPGGTTLARLLRDKRGKRFLKGLPPLTEEQILCWADAHFARTGKWPSGRKEPVTDAPGETWGNISQCLSNGDRGLPGGATLARLLEEKRGKRVRSRTTPLTLEQIGEWARAHRTRTGAWPRTTSGEVVGGDGTLWAALDKGLRCGNRGLSGGMNLAGLMHILEAEETELQASARKTA